MSIEIVSRFNPIKSDCEGLLLPTCIHFGENHMGQTRLETAILRCPQVANYVVRRVNEAGQQGRALAIWNHATAIRPKWIVAIPTHRRQSEEPNIKHILTGLFHTREMCKRWNMESLGIAMDAFRLTPGKLEMVEHFIDEIFGPLETLHVEVYPKEDQDDNDAGARVVEATNATNSEPIPIALLTAGAGATNGPPWTV